jgi:hypothetical protein
LRIVKEMFSLDMLCSGCGFQEVSSRLSCLYISVKKESYSPLQMVAGVSCIELAQKALQLIERADDKQRKRYHQTDRHSSAFMLFHSFVLASVVHFLCNVATVSLSHPCVTVEGKFVFEIFIFDASSFA